MKRSKIAAAGKGAKWDLRRFGRLFIFCITAGFLCPNVWIEGMDLGTPHDKNDSGIQR